MDKNFVHLHVHTEYSLLDGATKISEIFARCAELGQSAVAITDHGSMFGVLKFCKEAVRFTDKEADFYEFMAKRKEFKVKPIVGCELYITDDMSVKEAGSDGKMPKFNHIVLLCKNEEGYKNLIKLVSNGYTKGMYYKPRIDKALLKKHTKGLICLSACLAGELPQALTEGNFERADKIAKEYKEMFGDDYYIELQDHNLKKQKAILSPLLKIARQNGIKPVATNDVHYLKKEDFAMQKVCQAISFRKTLTVDELETDEPVGMADADGTDDDGYFPTREFYLKSYDEMEKLFSFAADAITNTKEIADKCDPYFFYKQPLLPLYNPGSGEHPNAFLRRLTGEGLEKNYGKITDEVKTRAEYELSIIERMGFTEYFLIVWDFIHYAESIGIPVGPGRGSGVGSIVAYALGITKLDPLKYRLLFERFLNPERVSSPDFDIDFCVDRRDEVISYVIEKYGYENVSQIVTFGTMAAKAAVKDVGRVLNHPYSEMDKITKLIPFMMGKRKLNDLINGLEQIPELKELYVSDDTVKRIFDMAIKIEGMPRQTGMHAAGVIICRDPIDEHIPMARAKARGGEEVTTTQFDMIECEELGLLKMDFLGLRTLTDIKKALDIIKQTRGVEIDFYKMEYDDAGVYELIGEGDTHAVFQLESEGMKRFMQSLKPNLFEDIIAGVALYRPGPMDNIPAYVKGKKFPETIRYDHPLLEPILNVTYGIMVYQEQVMQVVRSLAGYTLGRADELRRMISKKKMDKMNAERKIFLNGSEKYGIIGAVNNGVSKEVANKIFDDIVKFADYAFNKSHAAAYALLAYQTAYLKRYYTVEFITAVLNDRISSIDEITNYLRYLKERGIKVLPPDINKSGANFTVEVLEDGDRAVRIGMAAIKNVGAGVIEAIIREREASPFLDFEDFVSRMTGNTLNKRMLEQLIFTGTFDCFKNTRKQLIAVYDEVVTRAAKDAEAKKSGQFSFFDIGDLGRTQKTPYPKVGEYSLSEKLKREKEAAGVYLTGHPLEEYADFLKGFSYNSSHFKALEDALSGETGEETGGVVTAEDGESVTLGGQLLEAHKRFTKQGREIGVGKIEDLNGTAEIMLFSHALNKYRDVFMPDKLVTVKGKVKRRDGGDAVIWADSIEEFSNAEKTGVARKICFYFDRSNEKLFNELQEILLAYKGADETYIKAPYDKKAVALGIKVNICQGLLIEITGLLGEGSYKIV